MGGFIPEDKIVELYHVANIVEVISEHVLLKKSGKNHWGLCPFHADKDPSFAVSEEKRMFHCFGCGKGGNVFHFLMQFHHISFPEAVRLVAKKYGIPLPSRRLSGAQRRRLDERERLFEINQMAADYLRSCLQDRRAGKPARAYLQARKIGQEIIDRFSLGYAPRGWDNITTYFDGKKMPLAEVERAGLIIAKKRGYYDRFRDRIMFPIVDLNDQVVGFGGRCLDDSLPKYLNSPETPIYHKSRTLYGLPMAKTACRESGVAFVVEGYFDVLALHCHGIHNVVGTLGTALTQYHARILKSCAERIILVFDSDQAGIKAAQRCGPLFEEEKVDARVMRLPEGTDPDSFVFETGPERFYELADQAVDMTEFLMAVAIEKYGLSLSGKVKIVETLMPSLAALTDSVRRAVRVRQLSQRLDIDESAILEKLRHSVGKNRKAQDTTSAQGQGARLEETIIAMMLQSPDIFADVDMREIIEGIETASLKELGEMILERSTTGMMDQAIDLIGQTEEPEMRNLISLLSVTPDHWDEKTCLKILGQYKNHLRKKQEKALLRKIKDAEKAEDHVLLDKLLQEMQQHVRQRRASSISATTKGC